MSRFLNLDAEYSRYSNLLKIIYIKYDCTVSPIGAGPTAFLLYKFVQYSNAHDHCGSWTWTEMQAEESKVNEWYEEHQQEIHVQEQRKKVKFKRNAHLVSPMHMIHDDDSREKSGSASESQSRQRTETPVVGCNENSNEHGSKDDSPGSDGPPPRTISTPVISNNNSKQSNKSNSSKKSSNSNTNDNNQNTNDNKQNDNDNTNNSGSNSNDNLSNSLAGNSSPLTFENATPPLNAVQLNNNSNESVEDGELGEFDQLLTDHQQSQSPVSETGHLAESPDNDFHLEYTEEKNGGQTVYNLSNNNVEIRHVRCYQMPDVDNPVEPAVCYEWDYDDTRRNYDFFLQYSPNSIMTASGNFGVIATNTNVTVYGRSAQTSERVQWVVNVPTNTQCNHNGESIWMARKLNERGRMMGFSNRHFSLLPTPRM